MVSQRTCSFPLSHARSRAKSLLLSAMWVGQRPTRFYHVCFFISREIGDFPRVAVAIHPHRIDGWGIPQKRLKIIIGL